MTEKLEQITVEMPQLGESIAEATIVSIFVNEGDEIEANQAIIEVETNKAVMEVTAPRDGILKELLAQTGESYLVGSKLATLNVLPSSKKKTTSKKKTSTKVSKKKVKSQPHFKTEESDEIKSRISSASGVQPALEGLPVPVNVTGATYISPRMRARMEDLGLNASDLAGIAGSGAGGRVTVDDFEKFIATLDQAKMTNASPMRIAVADSMRRSWTRPLATVGSPVVLDPLLTHRKTTKDKAGPALYALRALALALAENPEVAGRLVGDQIVKPQSIDIGFAVEVDDGVMVPVISQANTTQLSDLVTIYDDLVLAARERKLPAKASKPGVATVTNFGVFGIVWATPIPLPEQNLVLGLGMGRKKPFWSSQVNQFIPATEAELTLSFDHRILDGGAAGRLLSRIAELLQTPDDL